MLKHVNNLSTFEIDHDGAVAGSLSPRPVINPDSLKARRTTLGFGRALQLTRNGVITDGHTQALQKPLTRQASRSVTDHLDKTGDTPRSSGMRRGERTNLISICLAITLGIAATPSGQADMHCDFRSMDRKIL